MNTQTKISTCSYCQARVILSITPGSRHELICTSCGAHLEHTEFLKPPPAPTPASARASGPFASAPAPKRPASMPPASPVFSLPGRDTREKPAGKSYSKSAKKERRKKQKKKKRRGLGYWIREAIDEIEDLFD